MRSALVAALAGAAALLLQAAPASAAPMTFRITSGELIVTASSGGSFLADPVTLPVDGESIRLDLAAGSEELISMSVTATGPTSVALTPSIDGYDTLAVNSLGLDGGPGTLIPIGAVPPEFEYFALIEDVVLTTSFTLIDSTLLTELDGDLVVPLGTGTAQLFVGLSGNELTLTGFALADYVHPEFGTTITIKTDFQFTAVQIPEPTSALTFAIGLLPVVGVLRQGRRGRS